MDPVARHPHAPDAAFDGGDLDCGNGLLLLIRRHIDPLRPGQLLEIRSTETSVEEDLPAWCRLTGNEMVSWTREGRQRSYLVSKGPFGRLAPSSLGGSHKESREAGSPADDRSDVDEQGSLARSAGAAPSADAPSRVLVRPLAVMGIGSWPRPRWLMSAMQERTEGRLDEAEFQSTADDAVRLAIAAQLRAGVDVVTDGEQRRESYANFVGARLENCQLIPLTDVLAMVEDPEHLRKEFEALDVPASEVRHPVAFGPLRRKRPLAVHELAFARTITEKPVKVALPGPYLLSRILWMECMVDRAYATREALAADLVHILRAEILELIAEGAAVVQLDEPVLTEVVYGGVKHGPSFMCGALSEKGDVESELAFARQLLSAVIRGIPRERLALHVCRGNWTPDERAALSGDYRPLLPLLASLEVGTYLLEFCTPRAGEMDVLRELPRDRRIGVGVVNPKNPRVEARDEIARRMDTAIRTFGDERVLFVPDCGFATFAHNPVASAAVAEAKLAAMSAAKKLVIG